MTSEDILTQAEGWQRRYETAQSDWQTATDTAISAGAELADLDLETDRIEAEAVSCAAGSNAEQRKAEQTRWLAASETYCTTLARRRAVAQAKQQAQASAEAALHEMSLCKRMIDLWAGIARRDS